MSQVKDAKELYRRAYNIEQEILTLKEDLSELKGEFTFHKEYNPGGLDKDEVRKTMKAAKARAAQDNLKEKIEELEEIEQIQNKYS
jgi:DNA repair exonuclease SbcCD ATPase subunit